MELSEFSQQIVPLRESLLRQAVRMTGNADAAEDLVQDVMLRLWDMRQRLDRHPNPSALAAQMLRNRYIDHWRHRQLESSGEPPDVPAEEGSGEAADDVALIRQIVLSLPPLQARVFRLKEIEGYDAQEIMAITGCSADALRQNLSRARRRIKEEFIKLTSR